MGRLLGASAALVLLVGCQNQTHAVFSPVPSPSPHTTPTSAILQPGDIPAGLTVCPGSGPIDVYLETLATSSPSLAQSLAMAWDQLITERAQEGAVSTYASASAACTAELGVTSSLKAATSIVAIFDDSGQADRAWESGVFGFVPPKPGELAAGVTRGAATGLGTSSFTFGRGSVQLASWHRSVFVALVVLSNLPTAAFTAATAAVDARLN